MVLLLIGLNGFTSPGNTSYMPYMPETAIAMMAMNAIGPIWSSAAPEFGVKFAVGLKYYHRYNTT